YYSGRLVRLKGSGNSWSVPPPVSGQPDSDAWATDLWNVSDYLVGPDGSLWYVEQLDGPSTGGGEIRKIETNATVSVTPTASIDFSPPFPTPSVGEVHLRWSIPAPARVSL